MIGAATGLGVGLLLANRFKLLRELGQGGLGHVWLAEDAQLDGELVACKVLRAAYGDDSRAIADLKREVLLTRRLRHDHILAVHTFWDAPPHRFVTMDFVEGVDLSAALAQREQPFQPAEVLAWARQLASALDYAHANGVLHRDVKPANILLDQHCRVRLTDFGIARADREQRGREHHEQPCGTILYMSPEQILGEQAGPPGDQYSLAITLYELLSGAPPFRDGPLLSQIQLKPPPPIAGLPRAANHALRRALAKRATARYGNCAGFVRSLERALRGVLELPESGKLPPSGARLNDTTVFLPRQDTALRQMRLGTVLHQQGLINRSTLEQALAEQQRAGERLGAVLVRLGVVSEETIARAVARQLNLDFTSLGDVELAAAPLDLIKQNEAERLHCFPLRRDASGLLLAMADPLDLAAINELEARLGMRMLPIATTPTALRRALATWPRSGSA